ncbi:hypothetical protein DPMN_035687 [Dreissena polymorpha]|uniref:Uncharacterized protein n=1 Tax=Dreissena polymorpha TaxID=45954 RepID=A0A9D4MCB3_DREPO|nr:hypothetical protein DPMN_035687 [Dreissena polymorpha]
MDKYNFFVLSGTIPQPRASTERQMRIVNYCLMSDMAKGFKSNQMILKTLEHNFGHQDTSAYEFLLC